MFKQCISIGCTVRTHFYYVPVLVYVHIPTVFQHLPAHTSTMFKQFLGAILLIPSTFPCAHPCCTPALPHAEKYPRLAHYACISMCISIAFLLFSAYYPLLFLSLHPALFYLYFLLSIAFLFHSITFCLMMIKLLLHQILVSIGTAPGAAAGDCRGMFLA